MPSIPRSNRSIRHKVGEYPIARISEITDKGRLTPFMFRLPQIGSRCRRRIADTFFLSCVPQPAAVAAMLDPTAESTLDTAPASRLVIRVKLTTEESPPEPAPRRLGRTAVVLMLAAAAVLLSWLAISFFRSDSSSSPVATDQASDSDSRVAAAARVEDSVVGDRAPPTPAAPTSADARTATNLRAARPAESQVQQQPDAPISAVDQVIPDAPKSALDTIRGTVRVSVRVGVDKQGTVLDAATDDPGPSRYFERLAVEASKKWTFTPATLAERRIVLLRFNFTRDRVTAEANPTQ